MNKPNKTFFNKKLVRPTISKGRGKAIVLRNDKPEIPAIDINEVKFGEAPVTSLNPHSLKKAAFSRPETYETKDGLNVSPKLKTNSKLNLGEKDSKKSIASHISASLDAPAMHSSLNIGKKIDRLGKMTTASVKSVSDKLSYDDKVTRQVNIPYEKKIYKDLIPLASPINTQTHSVAPSRDPLPPKDREPILQEFIKIPQVQEYSYIPNVKSEIQRRTAQCDNMHLYRILRMLEND